MFKIIHMYQQITVRRFCLFSDGLQKKYILVRVSRCAYKSANASCFIAKTMNQAKSIFKIVAAMRQAYGQFTLVPTPITHVKTAALHRGIGFRTAPHVYESRKLHYQKYKRTQRSMDIAYTQHKTQQNTQGPAPPWSY